MECKLEQLQVLAPKFAVAAEPSSRCQQCYKPHMPALWHLVPTWLHVHLDLSLGLADAVATHEKDFCNRIVIFTVWATMGRTFPTDRTGAEEATEPCRTMDSQCLLQKMTLLDQELHCDKDV